MFKPLAKLLKRSIRRARPQQVKPRQEIIPAYPRYGFMFSGRQLRYMMNCLEETASVEGAVLEVGCAYGVTTILQYEFLRDSGIEKPYICIDTFDGFTEKDIRFENKIRGKVYDYTKHFKNNDVDRFKENLLTRKITDVVVRQEDIADVSPGSLPVISYCLLDVDLYLPVRAGLELIYDKLASGGIIVVDDCWIDHSYLLNPDIHNKLDGAIAAYREFVAERGLPEVIVESKLGIIRKP
jgi:O-methyltransferase